MAIIPVRATGSIFIADVIEANGGLLIAPDKDSSEAVCRQDYGSVEKPRLPTARAMRSAWICLSPETG